MQCASVWTCVEKMLNVEVNGYRRNGGPMKIWKESLEKVCENCIKE